MPALIVWGATATPGLPMSVTDRRGWMIHGTKWISADMCTTLDRIWELRRNVTAYDAAYLALAEALDAPLLTCDRALASAPGHRAAVELIECYTERHK